MTTTNSLAPIIIFAYNRLWHLQQSIESLQKNYLADQSELFIFSDGQKCREDEEKVNEVRNYIKTISGFKSITIKERDGNLGLGRSVITGTTEVLEKYGRVIVIEDDLVTSRNFLIFMNEALDFYKDHKNIFSVTGYNYPINIPKGYKHDVFLFYRESSWGWGTWKDRWAQADWEVKDFHEFLKDKKAQSLFNRGGEDLTPMLISQMNGGSDSWAIRWCYTHFKNNAYCLYPVISMVQNLGNDGSGTHCGTTDKYRVQLDDESTKIVFPDGLVVDRGIERELRRFFSPSDKQGAFEKLHNLIDYFKRYVND